VGLLSTGDAARRVLASAAERRAYSEHVVSLLVPAYRDTRNSNR
jgi:hypothetical protein